jgi:hypothetical protein
MENGRYMTGPFGWLVTRCQAIKETYGRYYGVDACMAHLMRPGMYGSYHHITVPGREKNELIESHVVGTLCENNDWYSCLCLKNCFVYIILFFHLGLQKTVHFQSLKSEIFLSFMTLVLILIRWASNIMENYVHQKFLSV